MARDNLNIQPIGVIRSGWSEPAGTPIQPRFAEGARATVEVRPELADGLKDLDGFDRIWLLYWLDRAPGTKLRVTPFMDDTERGLFATRAPCRPNPIGMSCVKLISVDGPVLTIDQCDILDGTPLLDIKPYSPKFDAYPEAACGWMPAAEQDAIRTKADERFAGGQPKDGD